MHTRFLLLACVVCGWAGADQPEKVEVQHRQPLLSSIFPQGAQPGQTVRVEILGEYLDRASHALFSGSPLTAKLLSVAPTRLEAELTIPAGAAFRHHQLRVISPRGASNAILFRVGDLPHRTEHEPNSTLEHPETVTLPVTINARLERDDDFDFFKFHARAGETWIFDLRAARNGNGLDAALILLDSQGRKVEHDEDTFIWDPFIAQRFEREGDYLAVVQPTHRHNDPNFAYQLDIRQAAYLETLSPISLRPGASTEVTIYGKALSDPAAKFEFDAPGFQGQFLQARGDSATARLAVPANAATGKHEFVIVSQGRSNPVAFVVDSTPVNTGGPRITVPTSINGIAKYRQPERFQFQADAGQTLVFEVRAMQLGSPVDSSLRLLDMQGKKLAENDDATLPGVMFNKDSRIEHTFKQAGEYQIEMRNVTAVTGENFPYQLIVRQASPSFALEIGDDSPYLFPGQKRGFKVDVDRKEGFKGPVTLEVSGLPPGVTVESAVVPDGKKEGEIVLRAAENAQPGAFGEIRVASGAVKAVKTAGISSGGGEGRTWVNVNSAYAAVAEKPLFSLECAFTNLNLVRAGSAELKVAVRREAGFTGPIEFRADNLPPGVTLGSFESGATEATLRFKAAPDAPTGRAARVSILGTGGGQMQEAPRISFQVD